MISIMEATVVLLFLPQLSKNYDSLSYKNNEKHYHNYGLT